MKEAIIENLQQIQSRISRACENSLRKPSEVKLLLATKTVSPARIGIALEAGYTLIAENKIQELKEKHEHLVHYAHTNHFIGHLQSNKIKDLLSYDVTCIQSIDNLQLAEKLDQRLAFENKHMEVLIQVNTSNEESKFGVRPESALALIKEISRLENISIKGLMTIGLLSSKSEKIRECFQLLKAIQQKVIAAQIPNVEMKELSMGMSSDLEIAIQEGATIVRVGTAIFGERTLPDRYYWNEEND